MTTSRWNTGKVRLGLVQHVDAEEFRSVFFNLRFGLCQCLSCDIIVQAFYLLGTPPFGGLNKNHLGQLVLCDLGKDLLPHGLEQLS
jgi:hypothetical protein